MAEAALQRSRRDYAFIDDAELNGYLEKIGSRLTASLPPSKIPYHFFVADLPDINAFSLGGGYIVVSRKLISVVRSEDELAAVLGHEIGHQVRHDPAVGETILFREVLGVTQVGDRKDIEEKYQQLIDRAATNPKAFKHANASEESEQMGADELGLILAARAGYAPGAGGEFWDRVVLQGKRQSWLAVLFGRKDPDVKRLSELVKKMGTLPGGCAAPLPTDTKDAFRAWQQQVTEYTTANKESLHGVLWKKTLDPPLRPQLQHVRFSPDGKYVLAEDESGIYVFSRDPFHALLTIPSDNDQWAEFTPDSKAVVFNTPDLRVERWEMATGKRTWVKELAALQGCSSTALSPTGEYIACVTPSFDVRVIAVQTSETIYQKSKFYSPTQYEDELLSIAQMFGIRLPLVQAMFSPDGHYLLMGRRSTTLMLDLQTRAPVSIPRAIKDLLGEEFTFVGPDKIAGQSFSKLNEIDIVQFPSGEKVGQINGAAMRMWPTTKGNYLMMGPISKTISLGIFDVLTGKPVTGLSHAGVDIYDDTYATETNSGYLGIGQIAEHAGGLQRMVPAAVVPLGGLGRLRAFYVSPDFKWLAVSKGTRGGVWNLEKMQRLYNTRGFGGAEVEDSDLYAYFPATADDPRDMEDLQLGKSDQASAYDLGDDAWVAQDGAYLLMEKPKKKGGSLEKEVTLEAHAASNGKLLWSEHFPDDGPLMAEVSQDGVLTMLFRLSGHTARAAIAEDSNLNQAVSADRYKDTDYLVQSVDLNAGKAISKFVVQTGNSSFDIVSATSDGDWLALGDTADRTLLYSLRSGQQIGKFFGRNAAISSASGRLCLSTDRGELSLIDLRSLEVVDQFAFGHRIAGTQFSADGKRMLVLTDNQDVYAIDLTAPPPQTPGN